MRRITDFSTRVQKKHAIIALVFLSIISAFLTVRKAVATFFFSSPHVKALSQIDTGKGLVGHWDFDRDSLRLWNHIQDVSGQGNNGALTRMNRTFATPGIVGQGLGFDGRDDYFKIGSSSSLNLTSSFTLHAWVNPDALPKNNQDWFLVSKADVRTGISGSIATGTVQDLDIVSNITFSGKDGVITDSGYDVATGDLNNDGIDDLIIGAVRASNAAGPNNAEGETYIIYGPLMQDATTGTIELGDTGVVDVTYFGKDANDFSGAVAVGDLNNDGIQDLVIGADSADNPSGPNSNEGETYVLYGPLPSSGTYDLDTAGVVDVLYFGKDLNDASGNPAVGDWNNDGIDDLAIGAYGADNPGNREGETYVLYGPLPSSGTYDLDTAGVVDVLYFGKDTTDDSARSLAAGDLNNDGIDDLVIGATSGSNPSGPNSNEGETYVLYGPLPSSGTYDLDTAGVVDVLYFGKDASDSSGIVAAGDLNNDGIDDLVIGAPAAENPSGPNSGEGETYVLYGPLPSSGTYDLDAAGVVDVLLYGRDSGDVSAVGVDTGDLNNDGINDLVIGAYAAQSREGETYVVFGPVLGSFETTESDLDTAGVVDVLYYGKDATDGSGYSMATGDLNNDGINDLVIGAADANNASGPGNLEGETYVIYGPLPSSGTIDLDTAGVVDVLYYGKDATDRSGRSVAVGDLNGDGYDDLVIGAHRAYNTSLGAPNNNEGETYIIYGPLDESGETDLDAVGVVDVLYYGRDANDYSGAAVAIADLNNDGNDDLVIGAYQAGNADGPDNQEGEVYILYGPITDAGQTDLDGAGVVDVTYFGKDAADRSGISVALGDINNDHSADLIIGAYQASNPSGPSDNEGEVYGILGPLPSSGTYDLDSANVVDILYYGRDIDDYSGRSVAMGDLNSDGIDDLVIGAYFAENASSPSGAGEAYIVYGPVSPTTTPQSLYNVSDTLYFGKDTDDALGSALAVGDLNDDGYIDLVMGAYQAEQAADNEQGETYIVYGPLGGNYTNYSLKMDARGSIIFSTGGAQNVRTSSTTRAVAVTSEWTSVTAVYDNSAQTMSIYINGNLSTSTPATVAPTATSSPLVFGSGVHRKGGVFSGALDEVRLYNRALSSAEITALYKIGQQKAQIRNTSNTNDIIANSSKNSVMAGGLVGLWSFNGADMDWSKDYALDRSGQGNNGRLVNMATSTSPKIGAVGQALYFDGSDDYISVGNAGSGIKTISFWIKADDTVSRKIIDIDGTDQIETNNQGTLLATSFPASTIYINGSTSNTTIATSTWQHVIISDSTGVNASALDIGRVSSNYFDGSLDEVRFYTFPFTKQDAENLYNQTKPF